MKLKTFRKFCRDGHRDLGYFFAGLTILYCLSGLALNHGKEWDPSFLLQKKEISIGAYHPQQITDSLLTALSHQVGEKSFKLYDFSTPTQLKVYYQNATLTLFLDQQKALYEKVYKRPLFYQANLLHLNSIDYWRWFSDVFALGLIFLSVSGLVILKGKYGFSKRGYVLFLLGFVPPLLALTLSILF